MSFWHSHCLVQKKDHLYHKSTHKTVPLDTCFFPFPNCPKVHNFFEPRWKKKDLQAKQEPASKCKIDIALSRTVVEAPFHYYCLLTRIIWNLHIFSFLCLDFCLQWKWLDAVVLLSTLTLILIGGSLLLQTQATSHHSYLITVSRALLCAFGAWRNRWGGEIQVALLWWLVCGDRYSGAVHKRTLAHLYAADCVQDVQWVIRTWCHAGDIHTVRNMCNKKTKLGILSQNTNYKCR